MTWTLNVLSVTVNKKSIQFRFYFVFFPYIPPHTQQTSEDDVTMFIAGRRVNVTHDRELFFSLNEKYFI